MAIACPSCKTPMKDLFTGVFCPNDCDKPKPNVMKRYASGYLLTIEEMSMISRKVPHDLRDDLKDELVTLKKGDNYWIAWDSHARALHHSFNMSGDLIRKCDWVIFIGADGQINVSKNRMGAPKISDIPDMI